MIRILFASALPVLGLSAAAALLGPDLLTGPRGEPLVVAGPSMGAFQPASFDGTACSYPLVLDATLPLADPAEAAEGSQAVTLAIRYDANRMSMVIEKGVTSPKADAALVLVFNEEGRIVSAGPAPSLRERMPARAVADCLDRAAQPEPAGI